MKGLGSSPSFTDIGSFQQAHSYIDNGRFNRRHVRRGIYPGQTTEFKE